MATCWVDHHGRRPRTDGSRQAGACGVGRLEPLGGDVISDGKAEWDSADVLREVDLTGRVNGEGVEHPVTPEEDSAAGVLLGSQLTLSIPDRLLRGVLATVLGLAGLRLLDVPGTTLAIVVVLAVGMTALLVTLARRRWSRRLERRRTESEITTSVG